MGVLTTRAYTPDDAAAFAGLMNLIEKHAGGHGGFTGDDIDAMLGGMVREPAADTRLMYAPDGTLAAAGAIPSPPEGGFRVDLLGGVHPDRRGQGLGRELLDWQLSRAAAIRKEVAPDAAWEIHVGVLIGDETAIRLLRRFGLSPARYWFEMWAPTGPVASSALPSGLRSAPYAPEYDEPLHRAHMEAFADHWGYQSRPFEDWAGLTVRSAGFLPALSRIAFDGDEIAGYVLSYKHADPERVYIGHVGTRRPWRRRGIAGALLAQVLADSAGAGLTSAALGVDADSPTGAVGVYERVGFTVAQRAVTYATPVAG
jgi:mycothiol synthase